MNFLPKKFPPFPDRFEFDIYATLAPAKAVGGDLYDFFFLDHDHLFVVIGDVSDKGVPAALFMAVTKTLTKGIAEPQLMPSEILARVNKELCQDNETNMFVTMFCGVLELSSGRLVYSNAGHNPPLLLHAGARPEWLDLPKGLVLGGFEEAQYSCKETILAKNTALLLYTDGVTEAADKDLKLFGEERLSALMSDRDYSDAEDLVRTAFSGVRLHANGAEQSDDITIMALIYKG